MLGNVDSPPFSFVVASGNGNAVVVVAVAELIVVVAAVAAAAVTIVVIVCRCVRYWVCEALVVLELIVLCRSGWL